MSKISALNDEVFKFPYFNDVPGFSL